MDIPTTRPSALKPGDTVGIVAPAGPVERKDAPAGAVATLERLGFRVRFDERIFDSVRYLAGSDKARAEELMRYFESPDIRAVVPLRGGYGCARLLPLLGEKRLRQHCKLFMGFSDLTTLHLYFRRRFGWATIHGPMAVSASLANLGGEEETHLLRLWTDPEYLPQYSFAQMETWHPGTAEGRLVGGCLSLVLASLGTPYEIQTEGKILFLEELGEPPYRIDRMLTQLSLAGKLEGLSGFILGSFHECVPTQGDYTADDVLRELLGKLQIPILAKFPAGHGPLNWAFPLGLPVRLDADRRVIELLEPLVRSRE
jgi:muramoyltetrapeptide carboxypeptidase